MPKGFTSAEKRLMSLTTKSEFNKVIEELNITEQQKRFAILYYCEGRRLIDIAYSENSLDINEQSLSIRKKDFVIKLSNYFNIIDTENN